MLKFFIRNFSTSEKFQIFYQIFLIPIRVLLNLVAKRKNKDRVSWLRSVLRLRPVFEGAREPGVSSVPELRGKLGIFPSSRGYIEGGDLNFSKCRNPR